MTQQLELFKPRLRKTSIMSNTLRESDGSAVSERNVIYRALRIQTEPKTASEITHLVKFHYGKDYIRNDVARALTRLRDKGLVIEEGNKICPITNRHVIAWRVK